MSSKIVITTWYDTVSPESAENGEYASCGTDERSNSYRPDELEDAISDFKKLLESNSWECQPRVNEVLYASDAEVDYSTGDEHRDCLIISVVTDDSIADKVLTERVNACLATL